MSSHPSFFGPSQIFWTIPNHFKALNQNETRISNRDQPKVKNRFCKSNSDLELEKNLGWSKKIGMAITPVENDQIQLKYRYAYVRAAGVGVCALKKGRAPAHDAKQRGAEGIEPPTSGFGILCSTIELYSHPGRALPICLFTHGETPRVAGNWFEPHALPGVTRFRCPV
jgi:hypothetical protein